MKDMNIVGNRWYKCDLHLHTTQSKCFHDQSVTDEQWIEQVKEKNLNCVAVTDHNDYRKIDSLMKLGKERGIVVFPGVEVTCDSTKIHVLVLFDVTDGGDKVRDFLCKIDIDGELIGSSQGTSKSIFDVCEKAKSMGAVVIASHIDDYNGINLMSREHLKKILDKRYLDAVEVGFEKYWNIKNVSLDKLKAFMEYEHGDKVEQFECKRWRIAYLLAKERHIPVVCFSDNPNGHCEAKHGLWGIGDEYTWIQMNEKPDLKSLYQAMIGSELRVKTCLQSRDIPDNNPAFWVKSLKVENSVLNTRKPLIVEFNPHFNCIIGESGSGKSSIIRLIAGILGDFSDTYMTGILREQKMFYRRYSSQDHMGVFLDNSKVTLEVVGFEILYRIEASQIESMEKQKIEVFRYQGEQKWLFIGGKECLQKFLIQCYMQNQVYELAKNKETFLRVMDSLIEGMDKLQERKQELIKQNRRNCDEYDNCISNINLQRKLFLRKTKNREYGFSILIQEAENRISSDYLSEAGENELIFRCKPDKDHNSMDFSALSSAHKTMALLTILFSCGTKPLFLDQPENVLDNRLIYERLLSILTNSRKERQIIVATSSANISVNGEPEYIISLGRWKENVDLACAGSLDKEEMRQEICQLIEGSECAFAKRAKKYDIKSAM